MSRLGPPKYAPLYAYLAGLPPEMGEVTLTFAAIEAIIGVPLPGSAWGRPFWLNANAPVGSTAQAGAWRGAGWRATPPSVTLARADATP